MPFIVDVAVKVKMLIWLRFMSITRGFTLQNVNPRRLKLLLDCHLSSTNESCRRSVSIKSAFMRLWGESTVSNIKRDSMEILSISQTATEEFDELCFQFGIELDDDVSTARRRAMGQ